MSATIRDTVNLYNVAARIVDRSSLSPSLPLRSASFTPDRQHLSANRRAFPLLVYPGSYHSYFNLPRLHDVKFLRFSRHALVPRVACIICAQTTSCAFRQPIDMQKISPTMHNIPRATAERLSSGDRRRQWPNRRSCAMIG